ncbi:MAG: hypothetical protein VW230_03630 [Candidatus Poseidoniales archaeon]
MAEQKIYTKADIPENGFALTEKQKNSILELQDQFYTAVDNEHAQGVAHALDVFATKSLLFLERNLGALIAAKDTQTAKKLVTVLMSRIEISLLDSLYRKGFDAMMVINNEYHFIATGRSTDNEDDWRQNFEEHADNFFDDFNKIWDYFEDWFDVDLYISYDEWRRRIKRGELAEFLTHGGDQDDSLDSLRERLEGLSGDQLGGLSIHSIREYIKHQISEQAYEKAEFLLYRFKDRFQLTHEDAYKFHEDLAHIHLAKGELQQSLTHFETGLDHAAAYGHWDSRFTRCMSHILILQRRLGYPLSEDSIALLKLNALKFEPNHRRLLTQYLFLERIYEMDDFYGDKIMNLVVELTSLEGINLPPLEEIKLLFWIDELVASDESMFRHGKTIRRDLLSSVVEIAEKYGRWDYLHTACSTLAGFEEGDGGDIWLRDEYKEKMKYVDNHMEKLEGVIATGQYAKGEKDKVSLKKIEQYYKLCVNRNWTYALESLKSIDHFFGKDGDYDALDEFNGPYYTLLALLSYTTDRKFSYVHGRGREERFAQFREKVLDVVKEEGSLLAEARALEVLTAKRMRHFVQNELKSPEGIKQMLSAFDRLIEVNTLMNAMKFATSARSTKALFLLEIGEKVHAESLFKQVIEEFKELEPRNALFAYETFARTTKLYLEKPDEVLAEIDDLLKLDEFKENDTMEILVLKSASLMVLRGVEGAIEAENVLRPVFQFIAQKQYFNQKNVSKYNQLAAMYLTSLSFQDETENLFSTLSELTGNGEFDFTVLSRIIAKNRLEISNETTAESIEITNELGNQALSRGMVEFAYSFKTQAMIEFNKNEDFESARKIGEEWLPILLENQDAYRLQNIIFHLKDHVSLLDLLESYDALNLVLDFPNNYDKARLFQTLAIRLNDDEDWYRKALAVSIDIENRKLRGICLGRIWNLTDDETDFMAMKTFYDEVPPDGDFHDYLNSLLYHRGDVDVEYVQDVIWQFYTTITQQGHNKRMNPQKCLSAVFHLFERFGEDNIQFREVCIEWHQFHQMLLEPNSPLRYDFVYTNVKLRLNHAERLIDIIHPNDDSAGLVNDALQNVVDATRELHKQNPGYLYSWIFRKMIGFFKKAEYSENDGETHPLKSLVNLLEDLLPIIKGEMHGTILQFQFELLMKIVQDKGLQKKEIMREIEKFIIELPPIANYNKDENNRRFQKTLEQKRKAYPTNIISKYQEGRKFNMHTMLSKYGSQRGINQFVELSMKEIIVANLSNEKKVGFCDSLFKHLLFHTSIMDTENIPYKRKCLIRIRKTKNILLNSFKLEDLVNYAITKELPEKIDNEYYLMAQKKIIHLITNYFSLAESKNRDIDSVRRSQEWLARFYPWLSQRYSEIEPQQRSELLDFNFALLAEINGHIDIAWDVYHAFLERYPESDIAWYVLYRVACLSSESDKNNPSKFLQDLIINSEDQNRKEICRLMLCWYHIKETASMVAAQALANAAIKSKVVQIVVGLECKIGDDGIMIGDEKIYISKFSKFSHDIIDLLKIYNLNKQFGNDVLWLGRNEEDEIESVHYLHYFSNIYFHSPQQQVLESSNREITSEEE